MASTLKSKLESELDILSETIDELARITLKKYKLKMAVLAERGSDRKAIDEWLQSDAGKMEWEALKKEIGRKVAGAISRVADLGYFVGFANGD